MTEKVKRFIQLHYQESITSGLICECIGWLYEISESVGYKDYEHFSRIFKKNIGISTQQFREKCAKVNESQEKSLSLVPCKI
jgi:AraC-like DNA-binding protein